MLKLPEDIVKGLKACGSGGCGDCPYRVPRVKAAMCVSVMALDAVEYIEMLEKEAKGHGTSST